MRALAFALRSFPRELRSGEVLVLLSAVILAVGALTAVGFLTDRIGKAVARQANEVLAADLRLRSQDPIPDSWRGLAAEYGLQTADTVSFPTVVFAGDESALTSLLAVTDAYPLRAGAVFFLGAGAFLAGGVVGATDLGVGAGAGVGRQCLAGPRRRRRRRPARRRGDGIANHSGVDLPTGPVDRIRVARAHARHEPGRRPG